MIGKEDRPRPELNPFGIWWDFNLGRSPQMISHHSPVYVQAPASIISLASGHVLHLIILFF